jgi:hypothetical protein
MTDIKAVEVQAELRQIRTMADGTVNIILNLPEYCIPQVQVMLEWLKQMVRCVITLEDKDSEDCDWQ